MIDTNKNLIEYLTQIDKLQGIIYENLMNTFNELDDITYLDSEEIESIDNISHFKHIVLSWLTKSTDFMNGEKFKIACITCRAVRILGLLKYVISNNFLSDDERKSALGQVFIEYRIEEKYTNDYHNTMTKIKGEILKYITSKQLRKRFYLNDFCLQLLNKEKKLLTATFVDDINIIVPDWLNNMNKEELESFASQIIEYLNSSNYQMFYGMVKDK